MKDPDFTKLPKYAIERIQQLELQINAAIKALEKFTDEQAKSPLYCSDFLHFGEGGKTLKKYIQDDSVTFEVDGENSRIDIRLDKKSLRIMGNNCIVIKPICSNVVEISLEE